MGKLKETKNFCWWAREQEKKEFKSTCSRSLAKENKEVFLLFELRK